MMALPRRGLLGEHLDGHAGVDRVQVGERLVDHDQVGLVHEGGDQLRLLLHAAAQVLDLLLAVAPEVQPLEPRLQSAGSLRLGQPFERGEIFQRRRQLLIAIEAALLGHVADPAFLVLGHGAAEEPDLAAVGAEDVEHHADRSRLARAVGAEETEDLTREDLERNFVHCAQRAEGLAEAGE